MKNLHIVLFLTAAQFINAQLLITEYPLKAGTSKQPHPSAMLEVRSDKKGIMLPLVNLQNDTDQLSATAPVTDGAMVLNTSYYSVNPNIPTTKPAIALWDGSKWLFTYNKQNVILDLDKVRNFIGENTSSISFSTFPGSSPSFAFGTAIDNNWNVLIDSENSAVKPSFEFDAAEAEQRMVIDVEGLASINNSGNDGRFSYAVGIFVEDKLVHAQKFYSTSLAGGCTFQKYNIRAILLDNPTILNKAAGAIYNVKVAVRPLPRPTTNYTNLTFGNSASGCDNLNAETARSYMNILTIERRNVP